MTFVAITFTSTMPRGLHQILVARSELGKGGQFARLMKRTTYKVRASVWLYPGMAGWHFVTIPQKQSDEIRTNFWAKKRGWGSLPVRVTLGKMRWKTSIFPDKKQGCYVLPLKADVRKKEKVKAGGTVNFSLEVCV